MRYYSRIIQVINFKVTIKITKTSTFSIKKTFTPVIQIDCFSWKEEKKNFFRKTFWFD